MATASCSHLVELVVVDIAVKVETYGWDRVNWISFNSTSRYWTSFILWHVCVQRIRSQADFFSSVKRFVCQPGVTSDDLITLEESLCTLACGVFGRESSIYRGRLIVSHVGVNIDNVKYVRWCNEECAQVSLFARLTHPLLLFHSINTLHCTSFNLGGNRLES